MKGILSYVSGVDMESTVGSLFVTDVIIHRLEEGTHEIGENWLF